MYDQSAALFSKPGQQIVHRAMKKGTVGVQLLFEPAMLLSLVAAEDVLYELAELAKVIPSIGNYNQSRATSSSASMLGCFIETEWREQSRSWPR